MLRLQEKTSARVSLRIAPVEKSLLARAAALQQVDLREFATRTLVTKAREVVDQHDRLQLTERDSLKVLDLLENPPKPTKKMLAAARALPDLP